MKPIDRELLITIENEVAPALTGQRAKQHQHIRYCNQPNY
jgi:hypothetical protein